MCIRDSTHTVALDKKGTPYINGGNVVFRDERDNAKATRHILVGAGENLVRHLGDVHAVVVLHQLRVVQLGVLQGLNEDVRISSRANFI